MPLDDKPITAQVAAALDSSPRIVDDWRRVPRFISANALALVMALQSTWAMLDPDERASLPHNLVFYLTITVAAFGFVGLFIKQKNGPNRDDLGRKCDAP